MYERVVTRTKGDGWLQCTLIFLLVFMLPFFVLVLLLVSRALVFLCLALLPLWRLQVSSILLCTQGIGTGGNALGRTGQGRLEPGDGELECRNGGSGLGFGGSLRRRWGGRLEEEGRKLGVNRRWTAAR